jgi:hypothetical protein
MAHIDITKDDQKVFDRLRSTGRITHGLKKLMVNRWNICCLCDTKIPKGRPAFAGYDANGNPIFVGACCADHLVEFASPTYWGVTHTLNIGIEDNIQLWRYMDFAKFVAMLSQNGLYFVRADRLDDPFEGASGLARRESEWDSFYLDHFRRVVASPPPGSSVADSSPEYIESQAHRLLAQWKASGLRDRSSFISCWHANTGESEALWRLYCPPPTAGLAIRTTVGLLWDATAEEASSVIGRVHYIDFSKRFADIQERIFCKRLSLSHENEVRAVIPNQKDDPSSGLSMPCDLTALIEQVVISPFSPSWFLDVVRHSIGRFGFEFEVGTSELLDEPFY